ncbi:GTP cyclohydrolase II [Marinomonas mediterranea]|jgi:GTP cyclohydrolase II (EC 3.5.4.25)|uniref:GTP cyclohydrolase-2 n=1 Tax=Marinomonas mediterranea (strain ATCC 700492 / JCM 21426 / NBRC 103028 / MMB-1) TaxID=717774 RepID=F2K3G5_MARM1|nr:GTP cyclohydrolase II [Marinomonas mediterranea]ADZ91307.1 GTP cyclohydrolase-2 [Marinomonas mediterranea MMB-1]WCN09278.1 GTP cyclohydrolase II [Marinomonas mediterranea]WCN13360.1 GTP cyclohydrolase II [Marinomonas mediterranea]WCN17428.1 GTP cyclohydrolase II [Marinomonas mediterranea MMB-1]
MNELTVKRRVVIPMRAGEVMAEFISFDGDESGKEHIGIGFTGTSASKNDIPLVRLHSECLTGDVFGSGRCDCGEQLDEAIDKINAEGGYILYLRQEGRGIGLYAKLEAYALQDQGYDTYEANEMLHLPDDGRDFGIAAKMLKSLGVNQVRLLTNNPDKAEQLKENGIDVVELLPTKVHVNQHNRQYLETKAKRKQHTLDLDGEGFE